MRLVKVKTQEGDTIVGVKNNDLVFSTPYRSVLEVILAGDEGLANLERAMEMQQSIDGYRMLAPVDTPSKILCSGINYKNHKDENPGAVFPKKPSVFSKLPSSIIGPDDPIVLPYPDCQVDYEVELAFVIGKQAKEVVRGEALDYVFGYTVLNDVSGRDLQFELQHETIGKGLDTFCPIGPELVLAHDFLDPAELHVTSYVNGEIRQDSSTKEMLFDVPALIENLSRYITLLPGDIVSTGTPAGVGLFRKPPVFLKPGDLVEVEVREIGRLRNPVVANW